MIEATPGNADRLLAMLRPACTAGGRAGAGRAVPPLRSAVSATMTDATPGKRAHRLLHALAHRLPCRATAPRRR